MDKINKYKAFKKTTDILIFILVAVALGFTVYGCLHLKNQSDNQLSTYIITFVSFGISVIALVVALKTYLSIDAVNSITSMDGNVLQNENYSVSYFEMINAFNQEKINTKKLFTDEVFKNMKYNKGSTKSCIEFTDWLQRIIDNLIWLGYIDYNDRDYLYKEKKLLDSIDREFDKYSELSNGIQYVLNEHVKLIKNVIDYIEWSHKKEEDPEGNPLIGQLEDVRGKMIQNPISKIVYYDYLGLYYHKRAIILISKLVEKMKSEDRDPLKDEASLKDMDLLKDRNPTLYKSVRKIVEKKEDEEEIGHIILWLQKSVTALNEAMSVAKDEVLWEGYIRYNLLRVRLLKDVATGEFAKNKDELLKENNEVIRIRENVMYLYSNKGSYIHDEFFEEVKKAKEIKKVVEGL